MDGMRDVLTCVVCYVSATKDTLLPRFRRAQRRLRELLSSISDARWTMTAGSLTKDENVFS